ncbi:MAG: hypothetical protein FP814_11220 [Desulfobacterium sp.]|nr:hypothetical protein [Desulfobacterium sp.]MBU3948997.1 SurA N-terminal domain-containing protein [Pseudomonadota bacterium]
MKSKLRTHSNCIITIFILAILQSGFIYKGLCMAEVVDRVVAVVNNDVITLNELTTAMNVYAEKIKSHGYPLEQERTMLFKLREDILDQLINQKLTDQEIAKYELTASDKEIDNTIERIKEAKFLTEEELRDLVAKDGLTFDEFRGKLKENILRSRLLDIKIKSKIVITKDDIKAYYESHKSDYMPKKKYHLLNIIKKVDSYADEDEKHEAMLVMEKIYAELIEGRLFEEVGKDYSELPSIETSDLGTFKFDELSQQVQDAIKDLKQKEFTKTLENDLGYQIIYIKEIEIKPGKSLDEAYAEIQEIIFNNVTNEKFKLWIEQLRQQSYIKIIK